MVREFNELSSNAIPVSAITTNVDTEGDMRTAIQFGMESESDIEIMILMLSFRHPRMCVLLQKLVKENPPFKTAAERLRFLHAETFLPDWQRAFQDMYSTRAFLDTMIAEGYGVRAELK